MSMSNNNFIQLQKKHDNDMLATMNLFFLLFVNIIFQIQSPCVEGIRNLYGKLQRTHYVAAVVEYQPEGTPWNSSPEELIAKNSENYMKLVAEASTLNADIIVFPEYGLTTLGIPRDRDSAKPYLLFIPEVRINPCGSKLGSDVIQKLSCSVRASGIYVVINVGEIRPCNSTDIHCPEDGRFQFNTNVAFDRNGTIVAKYEKGNLYFEGQFNKPNPIHLSNFVTDFGVEFGLFTCFDIIFYEPAVILAENGIKNFAFPTAWVDELPFLTAIQSQEAWAFSLNVNLLASGYHQPLGGQLGSGIYSGSSGALNYTFDPESGTQMIIAELAIEPDEIFSKRLTANELEQTATEPFETFHYFLHEDLQNYTTKILSPASTSEPSIEKVCVQNGFCCELEYQFQDWNSTSKGNYRLVALNGTRTVAAKSDQYDWQVCGVIRCLNDTLESCSDNDKTSSKKLPNFYILKLSSTFDMYRANLILPGLSVLDVQFNLIPYEYFKIDSNSGNGFMKVSSTSLVSVDVQTIAMINKLYLQA